jgi:hypothetical protein
MKTVEFTTDIRPWQRGAKVALPDDVAARLVASGEAVNPQPFTAAEVEAEDPQKKPKLGLPERGKYQTKARQ